LPVVRDGVGANHEQIQSQKGLPRALTPFAFTPIVDDNFLRNQLTTHPLADMGYLFTSDGEVLLHPLDVAEFEEGSLTVIVEPIDVLTPPE